MLRGLVAVGMSNDCGCALAGCNDGWGGTLGDAVSDSGC